MAMGVSVTTHNNPFRHISSSHFRVPHSCSAFSLNPSSSSFSFSYSTTTTSPFFSATSRKRTTSRKEVCHSRVAGSVLAAARMSDNPLLFRYSVYHTVALNNRCKKWALNLGADSARMVPVSGQQETKRIYRKANGTQVPAFASKLKSSGNKNAWVEERRMLERKIREESWEKKTEDLEGSSLSSHYLCYNGYSSTYAEGNSAYEVVLDNEICCQENTEIFYKKLEGLTEQIASSNLRTSTFKDSDSLSLEVLEEKGADLKLNGDYVEANQGKDSTEKHAAIGIVESETKTSLVGSSDKKLNIKEKLTRIHEKVLVVDSVSSAVKVVRMLRDRYKHLVHAIDTEVAKINVKEETPVDHGELICFSIYCGSEVNFGNGKSCIWVDVLDGGRELLAKFAPYFEDSSIKKVWHNYSFDSHIIENYGIKIAGFHADTMHMARLWDSSRRTEGGYSLEALTSDAKVLKGAELGEEAELFGKISMKSIFGKKKLKKDGSEGKMIIIAPVEELQREERESWISYSALDAISTLKLYESMKFKLSNMSWNVDGKREPGKTMLNFYEDYWRPFGEILVRMEAEGMLVDRKHLAEIEKSAVKEQEIAAGRFRNWASKYCSDAKYMNVGSDTQLRQLFFGGIGNSKDPDCSLDFTKTFKVLNVEKVIKEGKKVPTKYRDIELHGILDEPLRTEYFTATGWPSVSVDALKALAGKVSSEYVIMDDCLDSALEDGVEEIILEEADKDSESQKPTVCNEINTSAYGTAYGAFGGGEKGKEACHAIASLCEVCSIDSLLSNFILPLQGSNISGKDGRVHCSLNINTETGRLSARRPNLQNQPALEKDRYKIREAFVAAPGNSLIVADYGQLELRILAHLTDCKSMMHAFKAGGDFHSRTAMNMYPHIRDAVDNKEVLLEWHPQPGEEKPPVPLLKDAFGSERRRAKMLNFSIAYGKTAIGLSRDWKVSVEEAQATVDLWYEDRPEVRNWQEKRKEEARKKGCVYTLLGRARKFPIARASRAQKNHFERAAINTPVQGSAADVAMCAMLEISKNSHLKELGWRLLLQVHDEVILEGPSESAEVAKAIVVECMSKPFDGKNVLKVDLSVDAKCAQNWYAAK